jgi:hypothetical protein
MDTRFFIPANILLRNYFAGAAGAAGAAVAAGAGVAAGASTFGASAGFCASCLQATTTNKEAAKSTLTIIAKIFFIIAYPPFTDFHNCLGVLNTPTFDRRHYAFF